jgi:DNA-binding response OmpR family regulator
MDVSLVSWPGEGARRSELAAAGEPRLLLVATDAEPPDVSDCCEDWVRVPCSESELAARIRTVRGRAAAHVSAMPSIDDDGVLRFRGGWTALPPVEARLLRALIERYGAVVSRQVILQAGWTERPARRNALDVHMLRLRRRVAPLGLQVRTVRSRGYLLEAAVAD